MILLRTQKNELFDYINSHGFLPQDFSIVEGSDTTHILYKERDYMFSITPGFTNSGPYWEVHRSPGIAMASDRVYANEKWEKLTLQFSIWLKILEQEVSVQDKWETLQKVTSQLSINSASDNLEMFSALEYSLLETKMKQLHSAIQMLDIDPDAADIINTKLNSLLIHATALRKFDWQNLFIGTIVSVIIQLQVTPHNASKIWHLIRTLFADQIFLP